MVSSEVSDLQRSAALEAFLAASPMAVVRVDSAGVVRAWNRAAEKLFGWSAGEALGRPNPIVTRGERIHRGLLDRALRGEMLAGVEGKRRRKDGSLVEVTLWATALPGREGEAGEVIGVYQSRSRRETEEEEVRRAREFYRILTDSVSEVVAVVDTEGTIRFQSPRIREVLGYDPPERRGRKIFEFIHADDVETARQLFERLAASPGTRLSGVFRVRHRDGSWRVVEVEGRNLLDDEIVAGIVLTTRDVTERKALEERLAQAERMEAVGRLAGGIAHDFNNLMTAVRGRVEMLLEEAGEEGPSHEGLVEIQRAAERAARLTRKLLAFSRRQLLEPETVDLNETVRQSEGVLRESLGPGIQLLLELDPETGPVRIDPAQLDQVLLSLLFNAREALPEGGRVTMRTANRELGPETTDLPYVISGSYVLLEVSDDGVGMDADTQLRAFEPFFTTKEKVQGKGLGLSMVYGVVKQSRGYVWLDSEPGRGTTVRIYLPRVGAASRPPAEPAPAVATQGEDAAVLVVEDEESVRSLVRAVLGARGYRVLEAATADEALHTVERQPQAIRLVLSDIVMPGMGGQELVDRLGALHPELRFILMSGYTDDPRVRAGLEERRIPFLAKPFTPRALLAKVESVLGAAGDSRPAG